MINLPDSDKKKWGLRKDLDPTVIIASIVALGGFFIWAQKQESRMTTEEQATIRHDKEIKEIKDTNEAWRGEVRSDLKEILKQVGDQKSRR